MSIGSRYFYDLMVRSLCRTLRSRNGSTLVFTHGLEPRSHRMELCSPGHWGTAIGCSFGDLAGIGRTPRERTAVIFLSRKWPRLGGCSDQCTQGPVVLVGHSIGGMIQQTFCRLFPETTSSKSQGIVFVHTTYTNPTHTVMGSLWSSLGRVLFFVLCII